MLHPATPGAPPHSPIRGCCGRCVARADAKQDRTSTMSIRMSTVSTSHVQFPSPTNQPPLFLSKILLKKPSLYLDAPVYTTPVVSRLIRHGQRAGRYVRNGTHDLATCGAPMHQPVPPRRIPNESDFVVCRQQSVDRTFRSFRPLRSHPTSRGKTIASKDRVSVDSECKSQQATEDECGGRDSTAE